MESYIQALRDLKTKLGLYEEGHTPCVYEEDIQLGIVDNYGNPVLQKKFNGCEKCKDKECLYRGAEYKD